MVNRSSKKRRRESNPSSDEASDCEYQVEAILDKRSKGRKTQYLLKWKGYSSADNTVRNSKCVSRCFLFIFFALLFQ